MFEYLVSGDAIAPDHDAALRQCQQEWGLPEQRSHWTVEMPGLGAKWTFARIQADRRAAPTALEILGVPFRRPAAAERRPGYAFMPEIAASQGDRPARNHSTVLSTNDMEAVADRLSSAGARFRRDDADEFLPFSRLWLGFSQSGGEVYDPSADAGLRIEIIPHDKLLMPEPDNTFVPPLPEPGSPVRMVARTLLVPELDAALTTLDRNLGWQASSDSTGEDRTRRVRFSFPYPRSADLELVAPGPGTVEDAFLQQWGPGPFSSRIAVRGLGLIEQRLVGAGVTPSRLPPARPGEADRLLRPAEWVLGTALEFVENED